MQPQLKLSDPEIEILRKLVNGEAVSISSQQRIRLELAGYDPRAGGIVVTLTGRSLARGKRAGASASEPAHNIKVSRDRRGRRMPFSAGPSSSLPHAAQPRSPQRDLDQTPFGSG